jgi:hypothetical protein
MGKRLGLLQSSCPDWQEWFFVFSVKDRHPNSNKTLICGVVMYNLDDSDDSRKSGNWLQGTAESALYRHPHTKEHGRPESSGSAP